MHRILKMLLFLPLFSCQGTSEDKTIVFLAIEKSQPKDGLYVNLSDQENPYIQHSEEIRSHFFEFDSTKRKSQLYSHAYSIYKKRYKESFYELLPTDFKEKDPSKPFNALVIDTITKRAYTTQVYRRNIIY